MASSAISGTGSFVDESLPDSLDGILNAELENAAEPGYLPVYIPELLEQIMQQFNLPASHPVDSCNSISELLTSENLTFLQNFGDAEIEKSTKDNDADESGSYGSLEVAALSAVGLEGQATEPSANEKTSYLSIHPQSPSTFWFGNGMEMWCHYDQPLPRYANHMFFEKDSWTVRTYVPVAPQRYVRKPRMDLPMIVGGQVVLSTPDSGSEENIMSKELTTTLGLDIEKSSEHQKEFRLGNNKVVKALGAVQIPCQFAKEPAVQLDCLFYVFSTLITPLIMGMKVLRSTETLTRNKHRLQPRATPGHGPLLCASINNPKQRIRCYTYQPNRDLWDTTIYTLANADTGSEIDLMSLDYCMRHNFVASKAGLRDSKVQFADGSISHLAGKVNAKINFNLSTSSSVPPMRRSFYILKDLTSDVLLGEDFLEETNAFETYNDVITVEDDEGLAEVNTIRWLRTPPRFLTSLLGNNTAPEPLSAENSTAEVPIPRKRLEAMKTRVLSFMHRSDQNNAERRLERDDTLPSFEARIADRDGRERSRREKADQERALLRLESQDSALQVELERRAQYERDKKLLLVAKENELRALCSKASSSTSL